MNKYPVTPEEINSLYQQIQNLKNDTKELIRACQYLQDAKGTESYPDACKTLNNAILRAERNI